MPELLSPFGEHFNRDDAIRLAAAVRILSEPTRLRIIHLLHKRGQMTVTELVEKLGMLQPGVSHQLHVLESARLVRKVPGKTYKFKPRQLDQAALARLVDAILVGGGR